MRRAFVQELAEIAERDARILLITGDLGFSVVEPFADRHPDRFFNAGVAEQNMVGLATGLAESGFIPFVYSIATFAALRPYEFVRNGPVLHQLPVRIVGTGGAFDYGTAGPTHHALEDVGIMRMQPGLAVICPADAQQTTSALHATWDLPGPIYFRVGKDETTCVAGLDGRFRLGGAELVRDGTDLLLLTTGSIAADTVAAAEALAGEGVSCAVLVVATLNPPPVEELEGALARVPVAVSVESHYVTGGLGSLAAEVIAEAGLRCRLSRCGVRRGSEGISGSEGWLAAQHGLSVEGLMSSSREALAQGCLPEAPLKAPV
ncbi:MAG: transketolase [Actinomycetota bacterium]|nr:transketolase [Actinomycetota bacterium]